MTLTISREKGIKALYSRNRKKILTYLFDKSFDWTLASAKAWAEEHVNKDDKLKNKSLGTGNQIDRVTNMVKVEIQKRIVVSEVLVPYEVDAHGDFEEPEDIEEAAHNFLMKFSDNIGEMHYRWDEVGKPVQSYVTPTDILWGQDSEGKDIISPKGTWIMAIKVIEDRTWEKVLNGELTGLSIGYNATRVDVD